MDSETAQIQVNIQFFQGGYCTHPEAIVIRGGKWQNAVFPSLFALIEHPKLGYILFDTGYSEQFYQDTKSWPFKIYALTTPAYIKPEDTALEQLQKQGIESTAIKYVIISHFHADHIGGLQHFPNAQFICYNSAYQAVENKRGISALRAGFLPNLLPTNFAAHTLYVENTRQISLPQNYSPFTTGFDLFGDQSIIAVELPGHAIGQLGIFLTDQHDQIYFLIADACWMSRAYQELIKPHPIANLIFSNYKQYGETLQKIHQLYRDNPQIKIIPTHCQATWESLQLGK